MWIWRRLIKISWTDHRSHQEVSDMVDENRSLMNTIRQRQKNWLGPVFRSESHLRSRRRQNERHKNSWEMIDWMKSNNVEYKHIKKRAYDREDWRHWRPYLKWQSTQESGRERDRTETEQNNSVSSLVRFRSGHSNALPYVSTTDVTIPASRAKRLQVRLHA